MIQFLYPKGIAQFDMTSGAQTFLATGKRWHISHIVLSNTAGAAGTFNIRGVSGGTAYCNVGVDLNDTVIIPGFETANDGLEINVASGSTGSSATVFYNEG